MITPEQYELPARAPNPERQVTGSGAVGALAVAGIATAIVILIWLLFYLLVFTPRATVP